VTRQATIGIGIAVVVVLGAVGYLFGGPIVALGGLVVGVLGVMVVLQRTADAPEAPVAKERKPRRDRSGTDRLSEIGGGAAAPLLPTWSPPAEEVEPEPAPTTNWDDGWNPSGDEWSSNDSFSNEGAVDLEPNPLDEISSLEDIDVIAEVERFEVSSLVEDPVVDEIEVVEFGRESTELPVLEHYPINEEVSTADDIMAASQATELTVNESAGENAELAKLLAKVQARLAAYE